MVTITHTYVLRIELLYTVLMHVICRSLRGRRVMLVREGAGVLEVEQRLVQWASC